MEKGTGIMSANELELLAIKEEKKNKKNGLTPEDIWSIIQGTLRGKGT